MVKTVVVLGVHRASTSAVAGVLRCLGVDMGKRLMPAKPDNPLGFFENLDFVELNERILSMTGGDHWNPPSEEAILEAKIPDLKRIVRENMGELWGFKDPRTALTIELLHPHLPDPHVILCRRSPEAIAKSLKRWHGIDRSKALALCSEYYGRIEDYLSRHKVPHLTVNYDELIEATRRVIDMMIEFLKISPSRDQISSAVGMVRPELRHFR